MVARYPELKVYLSQDRKWKERYHANMFDAVALTIVAVDAGRQKADHGPRVLSDMRTCCPVAG